MARNIRRRNRPTQSQPGLLDYVGDLVGAYLDRGNPWFSPNHPATIASKNIDWDNPDPEYWNSPEVRKKMEDWGETVGSSIGVDPSSFGGLLGRIKTVAPVKTTRPYKDPTGLLDFKKLDTDYPPVIQTREPLFVPQKKEIPDELKIFKTKEQQEKLIDWFDEGVKTGGLAWYNTNPLRKYAISEFGNKKGLELYDRFLRYVGATSPNTNPMSNIKQASYYNYLDQQGVPIVDDLLTGNLKIPKGYGRMSLSGIKNTLASAGAGTKGPVLVGGKDIKLDRIPLYGHNYTGTFPATAPKVGRFYENLKGNIEQMATLDAGAMRAIAGKKGGKGKKAENLRESASKEIYDQMEVAFNKFATQLGVTPAQAQASIWSGSAPYTGVGKSTGDLPLGATFMEMLMEKVSQTARITGQSPKDVLSGLLSGNQYLKGIIAPFAVTGGLSGLLSEQEM